MIWYRHKWSAVAAALVAACAFLLPGAGRAETVTVPAGSDGFRQAIAASHSGDTLRLAAGTHQGPIRIDHALIIEGEPGAVIDGQGRGRAIDVVAPNVVMRGLTIRNSGIDDPMDAAIFLEDSAAGAIVEDSRIENSLVGVYVHGAANAIVRNNRIVGRTDLRINERGNGVYVWNAPGAQVIGNYITGGRDGIFTNASRNNVFRGNRIENVRFAVHYMYTNDSEVSDNVSRGNHDGYVIMYSSRLAIRRNLSEDDGDHGLLLNYANDADIEDNVVRRSDQCVFIYNANKNLFADNWFEDCAVGIHFTAGSERNRMTGNAFVHNRSQVVYVGTRSLDWSADGRGNYWSDNPAFDLNGDGIADTAYRPNDIFDKVVWTYPTAKLLINSPAVQVIRWAQAEFPALHPGGVIDSAPLMAPIPPALEVKP
ncbi:nitrous oxide reductase family maturation protein NosD [Mesorhizobium sp. PAMC28654]|uniref:nitrous oxide reductase family maturation protein NosD n=1 Tax=Mesorhizobium sp. PAMC28654 TaxID=2880934 RepID=UPI001D0B6148|nr:nitrous oxide reductase family maturation protein NosD [Mesorhizobium sp. PAMC28654]UDL90805.1 nitrous oxide reductase family maturation protein NosD [Mesorhizobium sp. PAMC28654]